MKLKFLFTIFLSFFITASATANPGEISGEVSLKKGITLKSDGVLFVIAKNPGIPMPVAVLRIPNPKFPLKFKISANEAMVPGTPFKGPFAITARFSATGDAMDKSGPEAIVSTPVNVGTSDLRLQLSSK